MEAAAEPASSAGKASRSGHSAAVEQAAAAMAGAKAHPKAWASRGRTDKGRRAKVRGRANATAGAVDSSVVAVGAAVVVVVAAVGAVAEDGSPVEGPSRQLQSGWIFASRMTRPQRS